MTRPLSFDNISARLQGFDSTRLHENDWRNVVEYVTQLEWALEFVTKVNRAGFVMQMSHDEIITSLQELIADMKTRAAQALDGER